MNKAGFDKYISDAELQQDPEYQRLKKRLRRKENNSIRTLLLTKDGEHAESMDAGKDAKWLHELLKKDELDSKDRVRLRELYAKRTSIWRRQQQKAKENLKFTLE